MKWMRLPFLLLLASMLVVLTHLSACAGPLYYTQAISGHLSLMRSRVAISELLSDPATDPELAERLHQTELIRQFAHNKLELAENGNYRHFAVTGRDAATWNVIATPEFSLEPRLWCFPVAGCVAYRGYFDQQKALTFADRMRGKSFDVMTSPAVAYSTLGWFEDPLLDTMLQYSDAILAGIIFHELAHERLYVKSDTAFSEAFASFVEETGVRLWLSDRGQSPALDVWEEKKTASRQFNSLLKETQEKLRSVYASELSDTRKRQDKAEIFKDLRAEYQNLLLTEWDNTDYFAVWMAQDLNNAHLALMNSYEGGICAFEALYKESGQNFEQFYTLADEKAAMDIASRQVWLNQPCAEEPQATRRPWVGSAGPS